MVWDIVSDPHYKTKMKELEEDWLCMVFIFCMVEILIFQRIYITHALQVLNITQREKNSKGIKKSN